MDYRSKYTICGYVGNTPELRQTKKDVPVTNFNVAVHEYWTDESGERHEQTIWHEVVCYRGRAEWAAQNIEQGQNVLVEGSPATRAYKDGQGNAVAVFQVVADKIRVSKEGQKIEEEPEPELA